MAYQQRSHSSMAAVGGGGGAANNNNNNNSSVSFSLPPLRGGGANSSMGFGSSSSKGAPAGFNSSNNNSSASSYALMGVSSGGGAVPSHVVRNAYGRQLREAVRGNAQRRGAGGEGDGSTAGSNRGALGERISESVVDIGVREEMARRRAARPAIDSRKAKTYTVDWAAMDVRELGQLRALAPREGEHFAINKGQLVRLSAEKAEHALQHEQARDHERLRDIYTFGEASKQSVLRNPDLASNERTVVKAKGETYTFLDKSRALEPSSPKHSARWLVRNAQGVLEERILSGVELQEHEERMKLFRCSLLRLNNNRLTSLEGFGAAMARLLFRPTVHLTFVDLSSNMIATLPTGGGGGGGGSAGSGGAEDGVAVVAAGLEGLPIHTLLLHDNRIADVQELYKLEVLAPTLRKLTLYGNPVQRKVHPDLRPITIAILPFLNVFDDTPISQRERADQQQGTSGRAQPTTLLKAQTEREKILKAQAKAAALAAQYQSGMYGAGLMNYNPSSSAAAAAMGGGGGSPARSQSPPANGASNTSPSRSPARGGGGALPSLK